MKNRVQTRHILAIALPVACQNMLGFAVNLLDTVMLGKLGEVQISASALSNQLFFVLSLLVYGIVGGSNVLVAQFWGKKDTEAINKVLAYTYRIASATAVLLTLAGFMFPDRVLAVFTDDGEVIREGTAYLRIVSVSYLFYTLTAVTGGTLRSVRNVRISVLLSVVSLVVNGSLNRILIFGAFGIPPLGIAGAAIATTAARVTEFVLITLYMICKEDKLRLRLRNLLRIDKSIARNYFGNTVPVILNEFFWSVGTSALAVIIGRIGTQFVAANSIFGVTQQLASVFAQGLGAAAAVFIGNSIGENNNEKTMAYKRQFQVIGLCAGFFTSGLIIVLCPLMYGLYNISETTVLYANQIMWAGALVQVFKTAQGLNMMGILRGGGDAKFVMVNDVIFLWTLAIPLGYFAGLVWHLPIAAVYCVLNIEQFFKLFTSTHRLRSERWIKNVTV